MNFDNQNSMADVNPYESTVMIFKIWDVLLHSLHASTATTGCCITSSLCTMLLHHSSKFLVERFWMTSTNNNGKAKADQLHFLQHNLTWTHWICNYRSIFEVLCILWQNMHGNTYTVRNFELVSQPYQDKLHTTSKHKENTLSILWNL
jgi:hypothetical protein